MGAMRKLALILIAANVCHAGTSVFSSVDYPLLAKKGWQPRVRLVSIKSSEETKELLKKTERFFNDSLKTLSVSTKAVGVKVDEGDGVSRTITPTLELTVIVTSTSVSCFASASDLIPGTRTDGVVWLSSVYLSENSNLSKPEVEAFQLSEIEGCALMASHHFQEDVSRKAAQK
jgi:hypothetical protein